MNDDSPKTTQRAATCRAVASQASRYVDEALTPATRRRVAAHLEGCASCRAQVEQLAALRVALRSLPKQAPAPRVRARLLDQFTRAHPAKPKSGKS